MTNHNDIVFDCERMKHQYVGLYFFCDQLAASLGHVAESHDNSMAYYVPGALTGRWGTEASYITAKPWHKLWLPSQGAKVWHVTHQLSQYIPQGPKVLMTIHDLNFMYEKDEAKQGKYLRRMQRCVDKADELVTISEYTKNDLLRHINTRGKRITTIYNGCNVYTGQIAKPDDVSNRPFLFAVGAILPKKNFHVLPRLLRGNDYALLIAGKPSHYSDDIMREAEAMGVTDRVRLLGAISEAEKHWYLQHCTAFLFPSMAEGFGLPVIEAMQYGKPTFIAPYASLPEIGGRFAYHLDRDFDGEAMRRQLLDGLADFHSDASRAEAERQHALSFSWQKAAEQYWQIYQRLLNG